MLERLKLLPAKLLEIWNKYTKRQKTIIISMVAGIVVMLLILILVVGRTRYIALQKFGDLVMARRATEELGNAGIKHKVDKDGLTVLVDDKKMLEATYLFASEEFTQSTGFDASELFNNSMSTTTYDRLIRTNLSQQNKIADELMKTIDGIDFARVSFNIQNDRNNSILASQKDISCSIFLETNNRWRNSNAEAIAITVAHALGNSSTDNIAIIDQNSVLLFNGSMDESYYSSDKRMQFERGMTDLAIEAAINLGMANNFHHVDAGINYVFNYDEESTVYKQYLAAEDQEQGVQSFYKRITSESEGSSGNPPGTDSNDEETSYYIQNTGVGSSSYENLEIHYMPNEKLTTFMKAVGEIDRDKSSGAIILTRNKEYSRADLEIMGVLEGTTYEAYTFNNRDPVTIDVPQVLVEFYSNAMGIPQENLTIIAYEQSLFLDDEPTIINWDLILKIALASLIIGLLIFVIFRGMAPEEVTELEPELSVEQLLATTKDSQSLEDIEYGAMSETRKMIEKFVDENPEAVANLLRTWLEDDWE